MCPHADRPSHTAMHANPQACTCVFPTLCRNGHCGSQKASCTAFQALMLANIMHYSSTPLCVMALCSAQEAHRRAPRRHRLHLQHVRRRGDRADVRPALPLAARARLLGQRVAEHAHAHTAPGRAAGDSFCLSTCYALLGLGSGSGFDLSARPRCRCPARSQHPSLPADSYWFARHEELGGYRGRFFLR